MSMIFNWSRPWTFVCDACGQRVDATNTDIDESGAGVLPVGWRWIKRSDRVCTCEKCSLLPDEVRR